MKIRYFENQFLTQEFTSIKNREFVLECFNQLRGLQEEELNSWGTFHSREDYFRSRPIGGIRPVTTAALNIKATDLTEILEKFGLTQPTEVEVVADIDFLVYRPAIRAAHCYVSFRYVFFFYSEGEYLKELWFDDLDNIPIAEEAQNSMIDYLFFIGTNFHMLLIDWYEEIIIDLTNKEEIRTYLEMNKILKDGLWNFDYSLFDGYDLEN